MIVILLFNLNLQLLPNKIILENVINLLITL